MNRFGQAFLLVAVAGLLLFIFLLVRSGPASEEPAARTVPAAALPTGNSLDTQQSTLRVPVRGVTPEQLARNYGDDREGGARRHEALDIMAARGTPVLAAAAGRVEKLFESAEGGHTIYIRSPDRRWIYYYAHLDHYAPELAEGQQVAAGQVIAAVGSTGNADPAAPHLHFAVSRMMPAEAWHQGVPVDPYPLLSGGRLAGTGHGG